MRRVIAALVVVGLAVAVIIFWPRGDSDDPPDTQAAPSTTTITTATTTSLDVDTTTTNALQIRDVETVEQAEAILRELWFGWFEGIYNQDEDRIREVVILEETVQTARESFGSEFPAPPTSDDISLSETEILWTDSECLAVWTVMSLMNFRDGSSGGVHVMRVMNGEWRRLSVWEKREDNWEPDCESQLPSS